MRDPAGELAHGFQSPRPEELLLEGLPLEHAKVAAVAGQEPVLRFPVLAASDALLKTP